MGPDGRPHPAVNSSRASAIHSRANETMEPFRENTSESSRVKTIVTSANELDVVGFSCVQIDLSYDGSFCGRLRGVGTVKTDRQISQGKTTREKKNSHVSMKAALTGEISDARSKAITITISAIAARQRSRPLRSDRVTGRS